MRGTTAFTFKTSLHFPTNNICQLINNFQPVFMLPTQEKYQTSPTTGTLLPVHSFTIWAPSAQFFIHHYQWSQHGNEAQRRKSHQTHKVMSPGHIQMNTSLETFSSAWRMSSWWDWVKPFFLFTPGTHPHRYCTTCSTFVTWATWIWSFIHYTCHIFSCTFFAPSHDRAQRSTCILQHITGCSFQSSLIFPLLASCFACGCYWMQYD